MECFLNMSKALNPSLGFAEERKKGGRERERKVGGRSGGLEGRGKDERGGKTWEELILCW